MPCLSSRIPYGERVTPEKVGMIELAEMPCAPWVLAKYACGIMKGPLARIEVIPAKLAACSRAKPFSR